MSDPEFASTGGEDGGTGLYVGRVFHNDDPDLSIRVVFFSPSYVHTVNGEGTETVWNRGDFEARFGLRPILTEPLKLLETAGPYQPKLVAEGTQGPFGWGYGTGRALTLYPPFDHDDTITRGIGSALLSGEHVGLMSDALTDGRAVGVWIENPRGES